MKKRSRISIVNKNFLEKVLPIFQSWGLEKHPREKADFGRDEYGYHYEFADLTDYSNIKLVRFVIIARDCSLIIEGRKNIRVDIKDSEIPPIAGTEDDIFRLARSFSWSRILKFFDISFSLQQRKDETVEAAASRLIDDVIKELPRLKRYLYG